MLVCVWGGGGRVQRGCFPYYPVIPTLVRGYLYVDVSRDGGSAERCYFSSTCWVV